jgi:translation initiation factor IF-3
MTEAPAKGGPRVNDQIEAAQVRLIDARGEMLGIVSLYQALAIADESGLDLVEISPNAVPPVCKVLDFGKYKYEIQKKENEARKKQKVIEIKEIKMRPGIDDHDYDVKLRAMQRFIAEGDKVKLTLHQDLGAKVLERVRVDMGESIKVEQTPKMEGRQMTMVIAPK